MPHFFVKSNSIVKNRINVEDDELLAHIVKSLRVREYDKLLFFDENKMKYETKVVFISKTKLIAEIEKKYLSDRYLDLNIYLACSILKPDAFSELISGVTQLGIKSIYPLITDNTVLSKKQIENKIEKWQKISNEAVKQCERVDFMEVFPYKTLKDFDFSQFDKVIVFSEQEKKKTLKDVIRGNVKKEEKILVITGPEGGFTKEEFDFFDRNKFLSVKISNLILKAQMACFSGLSDIIYELSDRNE